MRLKSELKNLEKSDVAVTRGSGLESCLENPSSRSWKRPVEPNLLVRRTGFREVALARELGMCYFSVRYVSNIGTCMQEGLAFLELGVSGRIIPKAEKLLIETIGRLPITRAQACMYAGVVQSAGFE